ncbi:TPA: hypothetical protein N0F65_010915 [Lagenidium giganteum]|uniref:SWIM-type domain-containing protein n=1 Tax=Lagenidium giganteum TaxID=4803 RepID=A0AAV2Z2S2_9STRA|nr:TPA: hypothetical protein N0F65_010915 [Lagenidium giganteum]
MSSTFPPFRATYNDMGELRRELKVLSVQLNLPYYMHHSSPQRLEARCPAWKTRKEQDVTCGFVVSANRHTNGKIYVTRASLSHAPGCTAVQARGNHISAAALMETAKPMIKKMSEENLKPRDMANMIKEQFGVSTSYMTAWRALSSLRQSKKAEENASFMKIRGYLDLFVSHNEGSYAVFEHRTGTHIFARAFLCPKPLQAIPKYCRSALLLSVFLVTSTHGGVVMTVTAQDALGEKIPLAVGVVPEENEAEWTFFLTHLHKAIPDMERSITTLVHNRGEELQQAIQAVFPTCVQSNQVESFFSILPNQQASSGVQVDPIVQWMETLCAKTPLMILVGWVSKIASTLYQRFEKYRSMTSEYPEDFQTLLLQYDAEASRYDVVRVAEHGFEVIDHESGRQRVVDFSKQSCSCGEYDASKFPCLHVYLAISFAGLMQADFIPKIFLMSSLKSLYGGRITPIDVETVPVDQVTTPNPVQKTRGRPRKVQQIQQFGGSKLERLACSVCGVKGHNKRTCKRFVVPPEAAPITIGAALQEPDVEVTEEPTFLDHTCKNCLRPFLASQHLLTTWYVVNRRRRSAL